MRRFDGLFSSRGRAVARRRGFRDSAGQNRQTCAVFVRRLAMCGAKSRKKPKLGPLIPVIDAILVSDKMAPPKQRHTAKRIFERLRIEHGFLAGDTVVKDYVRLARARSREVFGAALSPAWPCAGPFRRMRRRHRRCADEAACVLLRPANSVRASSRPIRRTARKPSSTGTSLHSCFSVACQSILYDNLKLRRRESLRWQAPTHPRLHRARQPLLISRALWPAGKGERQEGRSPGKIFPGKLPHARAACCIFRCAQHHAGGTLPRQAS